MIAARHAASIANEATAPNKGKNLCQRLRYEQLRSLKKTTTVVRPTTATTTEQPLSPVIDLHPELSFLLDEDLKISDSSGEETTNDKPTTDKIVEDKKSTNDKGDDKVPAETTKTQSPATRDQLSITIDNDRPTATVPVIHSRNKSRLPSELLQAQPKVLKPNRYRPYQAIKRTVDNNVRQRANSVPFKLLTVDVPPARRPSPTHARFNPGLYNWSVNPIGITTTKTFH